MNFFIEYTGGGRLLVTKVDSYATFSQLREDTPGRLWTEPVAGYKGLNFDKRLWVEFVATNPREVPFRVFTYPEWTASDYDLWLSRQPKSPAAI